MRVLVMHLGKALNPEDRLVLVSMGATLAGIVAGALLGSPSAFGVTALLVFGLLLVGAWVTRSARLIWLLPYGILVGVLELWADWVHVVYLRSLVYTDDFGFKLLASPSYMPIGWCITAVQFGYLALRLRQWWPAWRTVGLLVVLGMCLPPWYEELAFPAHAWYYPPGGPMLSHTPLWVIGTYGGCMFAIATAALVFYQPRAWGRAVVAGVFAGAGILLAGVFWFSLLGRHT